MKRKSTLFELPFDDTPTLAFSGNYLFVPGKGIYSIQQSCFVILDQSRQCFFGPTDDYAILLNEDNEAICFSLDDSTKPILTYPIGEDQHLVGFANSAEFLVANFQGLESVLAIDAHTRSERVVCSLDRGEHIAEYRDSFDIYTVDDASFSNRANCIRSSVDGRRIMRVERALRMFPVLKSSLTQHMASILEANTQVSHRQLLANTEPEITDECVVLRRESPFEQVLAIERFPLGTIIFAQSSPCAKFLSIGAWTVGTSHRVCVVLDTASGKRIHVDNRFDLTFFMNEKFLRLDSVTAKLLVFTHQSLQCVESMVLDAHFTRGAQSHDGNVIVLFDPRCDKRLVQLVEFLPPDD